MYPNVVLCVVVVLVCGSWAAHWGYEGEGAPAHWADLSPDFAVCGTGKLQSPIDIRGGVRGTGDAIVFDYKPSAFRIIDNGHSIQINVGAGNSLSVGGRRYTLVQFHFQ